MQDTNSAIGPSFRFRILVVAIVMICVGAGVFIRLGHYPLWDDEANTALIGQGVWATGDTSALVGENIVAYGKGGELVGTKARYMPPLQYYLVAPFSGMFPGSRIAPRLPFAILGIGVVALMLRWLWRINPSRTAWLVAAFAICTNVSLILFLRQCRYFAPAMLFTLAIAYLYVFYSGKRWQAILLAICGALLVATNYLNYAALAIALCADYAIFRRQTLRIPRAQVALIFVVQLIAIIGIVSVWNPIGKSPSDLDTSMPWLQYKLRIIWVFLRDYSLNEFAIGGLLLLAPFVAIVRRDSWLARALVALGFYILTVALLSPRYAGSWAPVRYLSPIIPLGIAISVMTLLPLVRRPAWLAILAIPIFGTNLLSGSTFLPGGPVQMPLRSTSLAYIGELITPMPEPFTIVTNYLRDNAKPGATVCVDPGYISYPLMYECPKVHYVWQFTQVPPNLPDLPAIQLRYSQPVDYIILFGDDAPTMRVPTRQGLLPYKRVAAFYQIPRDMYRPELYMRRFVPKRIVGSFPWCISVLMRDENP